jgi:hypothetical protein
MNHEGYERWQPGKGGNRHAEKRFQSILWADLGSLAKREYLIKQLFDGAGFTVVYGESGCGKTFFALHIGLHIALDRPFFDRKVRQGGVLYLAAEGGLGIEERLKAFENHHGVDPHGVPFAVLPVVADLCTLDADVAAVIAEIERRSDPTPVRLIVIDTLSRVMAGHNENSPEDMTAFVANCDRIRAETGAHVLVVHHTGKDTARGARGHSALRAATDTEIEIARDGVSGVMTATVTKQRDQRGGDLFSFKIEPVEIGMDEDEERITSCVVVPLDEPAGARRPKATGQAKIALDLLVNALADNGFLPPASNHIPANTNVVPLTLWRRYCDEGLVSDRDSNRDTQKRAFNRASKSLQAGGFIGVWGNYVWPVGQPGQGGTW